MRRESKRHAWVMALVAWEFKRTDATTLTETGNVADVLTKSKERTFGVLRISADGREILRQNGQKFLRR